MTTYAVFLRGINVGGINIKMADLRAALSTLPLAGVRTLLATGNIICSTEAGPGEVKNLVEGLLREKFGYDAWVVVLSAERLATLVANCPYPPDDSGTHSYVTLASDPTVLDELFDSAAKVSAIEQTRLGEEASAWLAPVGGTLDSPFSKLASKPKYKASTTTRNLRTLLKILDAVSA